MPAEIGDIGFTIVPHPRHADTAWVFPMDGTDVWPRTSPGGKPAVYRTGDAGASWERQDEGFPDRARLGSPSSGRPSAPTRPMPVGLYLGHHGRRGLDERRRRRTWRNIGAHLPEIYSVVAAPLAVIRRHSPHPVAVLFGRREPGRSQRARRVDLALRDLDARFPGLRFRVIDEQDRIRRHMRIFVGARRRHGLIARSPGRRGGLDLRRAQRRLSGALRLRARTNADALIDKTRPWLTTPDIENHSH